MGTESELREKIAKKLWLESVHYGFRDYIDFKQHYLNIAGSILALVKEAGYKSPEEMAEAITVQFPRMASEMGYVKLTAGVGCYQRETT